MGKRSTKSKDGETRVLYKKSQQTIFTQSRTCSGLSHINTKSGILQLKKNLSQHQYYREGEKVKRDLSTETGICILRRYYKRKKNRMSTQDGSKSRYSTVNTEIDTIEEFRHGASACGHSEVTERNHDNDLNKIILDNFKYLLNNWIEKYLLDKKETQDKKESVLYSLLHRTELDKTNSSSSRSTYILNREKLTQEVKNKKVETTSIICQYCQSKSWIKKSRDKYWKESSCHSIPASHKNIKVISTLSIPKNLHKKNKGKNDDYKFKKNTVFSINSPSKLIDCSSFDLLTLSTNSFTKKCAAYDCDGKKKKRKKKKHIVFLPKPFYKSATDSTTDENNHKTRESKKIKLEPMPSLMKSIYADDPANITSTDDNIFFRNDNFTMTDVKDSLVQGVNTKVETTEPNLISGYEFDYFKESILNEEDVSDPMVAIDFISESLMFSNLMQHKTGPASTKTRATAMDKPNTENQPVKSERKCKRLAKFHKKDKKRIKPRNCKKNLGRSHNFLGHCQNIVQYLADLEHKTNMKLDIHITVLPVNSLQSKSTEINAQDINICVKSETVVYNVNTASLDKPTSSDTKNDVNVNDIIPLLDGAVNQSKYILKSESVSEKTVFHGNTFERGTVTDAEILDDITELKCIIKGLTKAAETFVREHVKTESKPSQCDKYIISKMENISRGIQFSKEIAKHPLLSGAKLSKEQKKTDDEEFYKRLMRKSTSYKIIESESILRVTDMTSGANVINKVNKTPKSLPNTKSMIEITNEINKRNLLTYFYEEYDKDDFVYNTCEPQPKCQKVWMKFKKNRPEPVCMIDSGDVIQLISSDCDRCRSSTMCTDDDDDEVVEKCPIKREPICRRAGMGFGEGCFYCMLMWIPVILIACLFYSYVIKSSIHPKSPVLGLRQGPEIPNGSVKLSYKIKLSDLGF